MLTGVEYVRSICAQRKIPVSQLEKDCNFSNGYLNPKKLKKIPYDRAVTISKYLGVPLELVLGSETENQPLVNDDKELTEYLEELKTRPELRMLFQLSKNATKEEVEQAVRIIEALRQK